MVRFDRECCVLYKAVMDELIGPEASAVVMSAGPKDPPAWSVHLRDKDAEEKLLDRFRDPADPLKFVIVTSKMALGRIALPAALDKEERFSGFIFQRR